MHIYESFAYKKDMLYRSCAYMEYMRYRRCAYIEVVRLPYMHIFRIGACLPYMHILVVAMLHMKIISKEMLYPSLTIGYYFHKFFKIPSLYTSSIK